MRIADAWRVLVAAALGGVLMGCSATGKPLIGAAAPTLKREEKSLRAAVEKDPFPRAQGLTASGKS